MRRGTAPIHTFRLPVDAAQVAKLRVNYAQRGQLVLVKTEADATMQDRVLQIQLTQKDTLSFRCNVDVEIQLDILTTGGDPLRSKIKRLDVERCLNDEVLA